MRTVRSELTSHPINGHRFTTWFRTDTVSGGPRHPLYQSPPKTIVFWDGVKDACPHRSRMSGDRDRSQPSGTDEAGNVKR
jgi:hypothetical protein